MSISPSARPGIPAEEGREAMPFDLELDGQRMDLSSSEGFCNALWAVANLKPGSGHLSAPVCSTFVIVSLVNICGLHPNYFLFVWDRTLSQDYTTM